MSGEPYGDLTQFFRLVMLVYMVLLVTLSIAALVICLWTRNSLAGLQGTWRNPLDPKHAFQFLPRGKIEVWYDGHLRDNILYWHRRGIKVVISSRKTADSVRTTFEGHLSGDTIKGHRTAFNDTGETLSRWDEVWHRDGYIRVNQDPEAN